jgi:hypothetical protein
MTRRIDFGDWQRVRRAVITTQTRILAPMEEGLVVSVTGLPRTDAQRPAGPTLERPAEGRPLHSHKPRSDDEWGALADGVRALLAERASSGRWRWAGPRRVVIS